MSERRSVAEVMVIFWNASAAGVEPEQRTAQWWSERIGCSVDTVYRARRILDRVTYSPVMERVIQDIKAEREAI